MLRDMANDMGIARGLSPVAAGTDNTPYVSEILDLQGKTAAMFAILIGANTDANATFTVLVEHGDASNLSDNAAVPDDQLNLTEAGASFDFADDNQVRKIGYRGDKRYVRVTITPAGNDSGNIFIAGIWLFQSDSRPVDQPS